MGFRNNMKAVFISIVILFVEKYMNILRDVKCGLVIKIV